MAFSRCSLVEKWVELLKNRRGGGGDYGILVMMDGAFL